MPSPDNKPSHRRVLTLCIALLAAASLGVLYAPTFYALLIGSGSYREATPDPAIDTIADRGTDGRVIVSLDADLGNSIDWEFRPEQSEVQAEIGKPVLVHFDAVNRSDQPVVARVVFDMSPFQAASYFFEVQRFCFRDVRLAAGETARIPMLFYFDKTMLEDRQAIATRHVSIVYTLYGQEADATRLAATPDLKAASETLEREIAGGAATTYVNDAPHD
jgi:cytochrome c oxidase assembly protein subunit 11